ncbi:hypothetical protein CCACVL1_21381 [Corchorus capsularis]|uniref:Uncharacterized protein n=1 Tax=Corchorus capsularis TaxID=210143 RepID=A0A1R3H661_COCAP|nr:hypothetical protein CCACVL1_21381 [Corchorus capsularis]
MAAECKDLFLRSEISVFFQALKKLNYVNFGLTSIGLALVTRQLP